MSTFLDFVTISNQRVALEKKISVLKDYAVSLFLQLKQQHVVILHVWKYIGNITYMDRLHVAVA